MVQKTEGRLIRRQRKYNLTLKKKKHFRKDGRAKKQETVKYYQQEGRSNIEKTIEILLKRRKKKKKE